MDLRKLIEFFYKNIIDRLSDDVSNDEIPIHDGRDHPHP
jgi:hypothetical protein